MSLPCYAPRLVVGVSHVSVCERQTNSTLLTTIREAAILEVCRGEEAHLTLLYFGDS